MVHAEVLPVTVDGDDRTDAVLEVDLGKGATELQSFLEKLAVPPEVLLKLEEREGKGGRSATQQSRMN